MSSFASIDPSVLDDVTGGASPSKTPSSSTTSALTTQLSGLQDSIKSLAAQPQKSAFSDPTTAMMFCALALQQRQTTVVGAAPVVYVGRRHW